MDGIFSMFSQDSDDESRQSESSSDYDSFSTSVSSEKKRVVLSVGGSLLISSSLKPDTHFIAKFSEKINALQKEGFAFALVAGGGLTARQYIASARSLGANNYALDEIGIQSTKLNAMLLIHAVEHAFPEVLSNPAEAKSLIEKGFTPVFSGILPGITTDAVAALIAETINAVFINMTNVNGIYSSNPRNNPRARLYPALSYDRLMSLISAQQSQPGQNLVLDLNACSIIKRSGIKTIVLNGSDLDNLDNALKGYSFTGTTISSEAESVE